MAGSLAFVSLDAKGRATLPEEIRASLGVSPGDLILLERTERGTFELVPAALVPRDQLWFYSTEVRRRIARGEADLDEGRSSGVRTPEEAKRLLGGLKRPGKRANNRAEKRAKKKEAR